MLYYWDMTSPLAFSYILQTFKITFYPVTLLSTSLYLMHYYMVYEFVLYVHISVYANIYECIMNYYALADKLPPCYYVLRLLFY